MDAESRERRQGDSSSEMQQRYTRVRLKSITGLLALFVPVDIFVGFI